MARGGTIAPPSGTRASDTQAPDSVGACAEELVESSLDEQVGGDDLTTRQRVLASILSHGPSTAAELGERLCLTPAAVRRHLSVLLDSGVVASREQRVYGQRGRGRPAKVFLLTDAGRESFPQAYDRLAHLAINQLVEQGGQEALTRLARERVRDIEQAYAALDGVEDPVARLAEALNRVGYVTSVEPVASGQQLCQHHCPVPRAAEEFPQFCATETELFSRLLGSHVQRLATIAHGEGVCTTHVPHPVAGNPVSHETPGPAGSSQPTNVPNSVPLTEGR